jgi:biotin synthase
VTETCPNIPDLPTQTRVSLGTAIVLGLTNGKMDAAPTTAYLMTYKTGKCTANCGFCPQAKNSKSNTEMLSRVTWPTFPTAQLVEALGVAIKAKKIRRVCIQALNYPEVFMHVEALVKEIKKTIDLPVSVSCQPLNSQNILRLKNVGAGRVGIALDAATETIFRKIKGVEAGSVYSWPQEFSLLEDALAVFGAGNVSTHLIVGLGETEKEAAGLVQRCVDWGVLPALFAFTPVRGTAMEKHLPPSIESYRRIQLARYLLTHGITRFERMEFDATGKVLSFGVEASVLEPVVNSGKPFRTSGCPDCNRPYYNEKPSGPVYNYPKELSHKEIEEIKGQLKI